MFIAIYCISCKLRIVFFNANSSYTVVYYTYATELGDLIVTMTGHWILLIEIVGACYAWARSNIQRIQTYPTMSSSDKQRCHVCILVESIMFKIV